MILFLFGQAGTGKNYIGEMLAAHFGYYFWDADLALPQEMRLAIANKEIFTQEMRDQFTQIMIKKTLELMQTHENLVIAQALYKEKNRKQIATAIPEIKFILIQADLEKIMARIKRRNNSIDVAYAKKIQAQFEEPLLPYQQIVNNTDQEDIVKQLQVLHYLGKSY